MNKWYTFIARYYDTSLDENGEWIGEYKTFTNVTTSAQEVIKNWLHDMSKDMKQSNPYNLLWIMTNWNTEDASYIKKESPNDEYWSGEKEDSIYLDLTNEVERIFAMTEADGKDDFEAYCLLKERGYLPGGFKGTKYEKWAKDMTKKYGWEKEKENEYV